MLQMAPFGAWEGVGLFWVPGLCQPSAVGRQSGTADTAVAPEATDETPYPIKPSAALLGPSKRRKEAN